MRSPRRVSLVLAVAAALLAAAEAVWVVAFLGSSSDGPAFAMALVACVLVPVLLAAAGAAVLEGLPSRIRAVGVGAVSAAGLAAAGLEAGGFVADTPVDPAFIHWTADAFAFAYAAAAVLTGVLLWSLLRSLPVAVRGGVAGLLAVVGPAVAAAVLLVGMPLVVLVGLAAPVVLVAVGRRARSRQDATRADRRARARAG